MLPVGRREVVERQQLSTILGQARDGFRVLRVIGRNKAIKGGLGIGAGIGLPDRVQYRLEEVTQFI
jgi:hypothetical protein